MICDQSELPSDFHQEQPFYINSGIKAWLTTAFLTIFKFLKYFIREKFILIFSTPDQARRRKLD